MFVTIVYAQTENVQNLITATGSLFNNLIYIFFGLALLVFLWGLAVFILSAGNEEKHSDARRLMLWGLIFLFVISSVWGIVVFLRQIIGLEPVTSTSTQTQQIEKYPDLDTSMGTHSDDLQKTLDNKESGGSEGFVQPKQNTQPSQGSSQNQIDQSYKDFENETFGDK